MSTALISITDMERMALAFSKSGMFGAKTPDQALSLLLLAQAEGLHPAIAMRDFDVIQGRPAKKAEAMLRSFLAAGGKVEWHRLDDEGAAATFSHPQGGTVRIDWDAARAKKAGLSSKDMYSKYARPMYRSRVVSEGCRTIYPAATSGMYVPEEVRQILKEDRRTEKDMGAAQVVTDADDAALQAIEQNATPPQAPLSEAGIPPVESPPAAAVAPISADQHIALMDALRPIRNGETRFLHQAGLERLTMLPASEYRRAMAWCEAATEQGRKAAKGAK